MDYTAWIDNLKIGDRVQIRGFLSEYDRISIITKITEHYILVDGATFNKTGASFGEFPFKESIWPIKEES